MLLTAARRSNSNSKHRVRGMDISRGEPVLAAPDRGGGASTASQRVLLVEDENLVALEMEQWLVEAGHEVIGIVSSAEAAIDVAEQRLPDMIVMDIRLAGHRDGVYAAQQIYASLGIRSLFSSAHADDWTRLRAAPAKPLGWLGKPYGRMEFLRAVGRAVGQLQEHS
jgi:DNA-binding NarL/FixJ family response regulator